MSKRFVIVIGIVAVCAMTGWVFLWYQPARLPSHSDIQEETPVSRPQEIAHSTPIAADAPESKDMSCRASGSVVYEDTRTPQAGLSVVARAKENIEVKTITDRKGRFVFNALQPGVEYELEVETPQEQRYVSESVAVTLEPGKSREDLILRLSKATGSISGFVYEVPHKDYSDPLSDMESRSLKGISRQDLEAQYLGPLLSSPSSKSLAGVVVRLEGPEGIRETTSVFLGRYSFTGLAPGRHQVTAFMSASASTGGKDKMSSQEVDLDPFEREDEVNLYLRDDAIGLSGKVVDSQGKPLAGATVMGERMISSHQSEQPDLRHSLSARTDQEGRYHLEGLIPPDLFNATRYLFGSSEAQMIFYRLRAEQREYVSVEASVPIFPESMRTEARRLAAVLLYYEGDEESQAVSIPDVPLPESKGKEITGIGFVLLKSATIEGVLTDLSGTALIGTDLQAESVEPPQEGPLEVHPSEKVYTVKSQEQGRFRFEGVPEGVYAFKAFVAGVGRKTSPDSVRVREGEKLRDVRIAVDTRDARGAISGMVISASTGQPIKDFEVYVQNIESKQEDPKTRGDMTKLPDEPGAFVVEGISSGGAKLDVSAPGYAPQAIHVEIKAGATSSVNVALEDEGILRVRATCYGEIVEAEVEALADGDEIWKRSSSTTEDGWQIINGLPPGGYIVRVSRLFFNIRGVHAIIRCENASMNVEPGTTQDVGLDLGGNCGFNVSVTGPEPIQVIVFDSTAEIPSDFMEAMHSPYARLFAQHVRYPGSIEIAGLPEGTYRVAAWPVSEAKTMVSHPVVLTPGKLAQVQFDF